MADLLLELFSEEIPARMQKDALEYLTGKLAEKLGASAKGFVTPRRVAAIVGNLPAVQPDINLELKGPKIGAPEAALQGFLKKNNLKQSDLTERDGVYFAAIHQKGKPTAEVLKATIEEILASFPWPKSMRWGHNETSWVRPLHSILCIFDGKIVPVEFAGVKAGNTTKGHRFLAPKEIIVKKAGDYESLLEKAFVVADREKRRADILKQAERIAAAKDLKLIPDVLEEVTGLVEWPVLLAGKIDPNYMDLPKEVLVSEMRAHQKYFALENKDGSLSDTFLITSNMETRDKGKAIIAGNERVLRARLADGRFFWDQDRKKKLDDMAKGLASVTYHAKLGSIADKVERITQMALALIPSVNPGLRREDVARTAALCKADLVSGMVGEFPELQGVMGRYYALHWRENPAVANAIRDHYLPLGPATAVPKEPLAVCAALADKLDTLVSLFAIGEKPTGSKDPFALRRAALGIIRIILENKVRLQLKPCFAAAPAKTIALAMSQEKLAKKTEDALSDPHKVGKYLTVNESATTELEEAVPAGLAQTLYDFFIDRLIVQLKDSGVRHDVIKAVVSNGDDDLVRIVARAKAVQDFLATDDGANLLTAYKRAANILSIEEKKDKTSYLSDDLNAAVLKDKEETALAQALAALSGRIDAALKAEQFVDAMKALAGLRTSVDLFFDKTMVNCEERQLRTNRLRLLAKIKDSMDGIANFSAIEGDIKEQKKAA
jgi:glycyl-tRNA synthetase beta chain